MTMAPDIQDGVKLPQDVDLEQAVLGSCLARPELIDAILEVCSAQDFFHVPHPAIAEAIASLHAEQMPVTPLTVAGRMATNGGLAEIGGKDYLAAMMMAAPASGIIPLARSLVDLRLRREAIMAAQESQDALGEPAISITEAMRPVLAAADHVATALGRRDFTPVRQAAEAMLRRAEDRANGQKDDAATTGLTALDEGIGGLQGGDLVVYAGRPGMGKEQPVDTPTLTPNGWVPLGTLRPGDLVIGGNGKPTRILAIHPQGVKQAYRVTFRDGASVECGAEHLWYVAPSSGRARKTFRAVPLKELIASGISKEKKDGRRGARWRIPLCCPIEFAEGDLPIHPYILGVLLGDGSTNGSDIRFSTPDFDRDIKDRVESLLPSDIFLKENRSGACPYFSFRGDGAKRIKAAIGEYGLNVKSAFKFIPAEYMMASARQRWELLRGLMDTDGCCRANRTSFSTTSPMLAEGVQSLVRSLGGMAILKSRVRERHDGARYVEFALNVKISTCPFHSSRKSSSWRPLRTGRYIFDVRKTRMVEQMCITVEASDGLYITDDYIVTHNTAQLANTALRAAMQGRPVLFFSLEMTQEALLQRMGADLDFDTNPDRPISYSWFRNGTARHDDIGRVAEALKRLPDSLMIFENGSLTIQEIAAISRAKAAQANGMGLIVIDYLQKVTAGDRYKGNRVQEVTEISGAAKALAMRLKWPVVVGAQLNRGVENREEKRPTLTDLRESGSIEQDADVVVGLFRPAYYVEKRKPAAGALDPAWNAWQCDYEEVRNRLDLHILKNRNGAEDSFSVFCDMRASAIRDAAPRWTP